jgi:hypothetical protein
MRAAQLQKLSTLMKTSSSSTECSTSGSSLFEESIILPAPDTVEDSKRSDGECVSSDEEYEGEFHQSDAHEVYKDWLSTVPCDDLKMMALMLHDRFTEHWSLTKTSAAVEVGHILGLNEKTVRTWRKDFFLNKGEFSVYQRGSYERYIVLQDEEYQKMAVDWVRTHSYVKGRPHMTAQHFGNWVKESLLPVVSQYHPQIQQHITVRTAAR